MSCFLSGSVGFLEIAGYVGALFLHRPIPLAGEIASLPAPYREGMQGLPETMEHYYRNEILSSPPPMSRKQRELYETVHTGGTGLPIPDAERLDRMATTLLEGRLQPILERHPKDPNQPDWYYFYFQASDLLGRPAEIALRAIGVIPRKEMRGIVFDLRGYGHGFEHDFARMEGLLRAGFAVFTFDKIDHGLSSRWDPLLDHLRGAALYVTHTIQFLAVMEEFLKKEIRFATLPRFAIASSMAGSHLVGAMRETGGNLGLDRVVFDSPRWQAGKRYSWWDRNVRLPFYHRHPEAAMEKFARRIRPPRQLRGMSAERHAYLERYWRAGAGLWGPSIPNFDFEREDRKVRKWLRSGAARDILPPAMLLVSPEDVEVDPFANLALFAATATDSSMVRLTEAHSPFSAGGDERLVPDVVDFLLGREAGERLFAGRQGIRDLTRQIAAG